MAYVVRSSISPDGASAATTHTVTLPEHSTNDLLVVLVGIDRFGSADGGNFTVTTATGWTNAARDAVAGQNRYEIWYKVAASGAETNPVFNTPAAADTWASIAIVIRDADTAAPIDAVGTVIKTGATEYAGPTVTSTTANCLILNTMCHWSLNQPLHAGGLMWGNLAMNTNVRVAFGWTVNDAAGASIASRWTVWTGYACIGFAIAIKNASGGHVPGYVDPATTIADLITPMTHQSSAWSTAANAGGSVTIPGSIALTAIGTKATVTYQGVNMDTKAGRTPLASVHRQSVGSAAVATTVTRGHQYTFGTTTDFTSGMLALNFLGASPSEMAVSMDPVGSGGTLLTVADASNNYRAFEIAGRDSNPLTLGWNVAVLDVNQSVTDWAESGTPPTVSAIKQVVFTVTPSGGSIFTGITLSEMWRVYSIHCSGGDSTTPFDFDDLVACGNSFRSPMIQKTGSAAALSFMPIQFGGGDAIKMEIENSVLQFAEAWNTSTKAVNFHADSTAQKLGVTYYGVSGDSIKHKNSLVTSATPFYVTIHASSTSAATWDFAGLTIAGAGTVTLRPVTTFTSMTFADCATITTAGGTGTTLTSCTFNNTTNTPDFTSDTLNSCNITAAAGGTCALIDTSTTLENVVLTAGNSSSYGLEMAQAGIYDLETVSWASFASGKKVNITAGSGTFQLNADGRLATVDVTSAGVTLIFDVVTTTVKHLTLTNGARYQIYNVTTATELANSTAGVSGFTYTTTSAISTGNVIRLRATYINGATSWSYLEATGTATAGGTLDFGANSLTADTTYANYAINGSTVSEFSTDYVNVECDVSDPDHQTTKKRLYAWLRYVQTTSDGIKNWWGAVTALDDANIKINASVVDLQIENNGTQVVRFTDTDIYMYRDDGVTIAASTGQGIIWESGKVYIAETGVSGLTAAESAQLTQASAASTVSAKIQYTIAMSAAGVVHTDIKAVKGLTIGGTGTASDPWGPA